MSKKLTDSELTEALASLPEWNLEGEEIVRALVFEDFRQAMAFVNRVADLAQSADHHPDIDIRYNHVRLALVTHDAGGITQRDIDLASGVDAAIQL